MNPNSQTPLDTLSSGSAGQAAFLAALDQMWATVLHLLTYLLWALMVGLAASAGCWCCGYAARETWLRMRPAPLHHPGEVEASQDGTDDGIGERIDLTVAQEAADGIREIEAYLARVS